MRNHNARLTLLAFFAVSFAVWGTLVIVTACLQFSELTASLFLVPMLFAAVLMKHGGAWLWTHGTGCEASVADLYRRQMLDQKPGIVIGVVNKPTINRSLRMLLSDSTANLGVKTLFTRQKHLWVTLPQAIHSATFCPSGGGKTQGVLIGSLLNVNSSAFVYDPQGAVYKATKKILKRRCYEIILLDPFGVTGDAGHTINPMSGLIKGSPNLLDAARSFVDGLVVSDTKSENAAHFEDLAKVFLTCGTGAMVEYCDPPQITIENLIYLMSDTEMLRVSIERMKENLGYRGAFKNLAGMTSAARDRELSSVLTTVGRTLAPFNTPSMLDATASTSFDLQSFGTNNRTVIFLAMPPQYVYSHAAYVRSIITACMQPFMNRGAEKSKPTHFFLDETATLKDFKILSTALFQLRAYGIRLNLFFQGLDQLREVFPPQTQQAVLSNVTQLFMGTNSLEEAEYLAKRFGQQTLSVSSSSRSWNTGRSYDPTGRESYSTGLNGSVNSQEIGRQYLFPDEILRLSRDTMITVIPSLPPIITRNVPFYSPQFQLLKPIKPHRLRFACALCSVVTGILGVCWIAILLAVEHKDARNAAMRDNRKPPIGVVESPAKQDKSPINKRLPKVKERK